MMIQDDSTDGQTIILMPYKILLKTLLTLIQIYYDKNYKISWRIDVASNAIELHQIKCLSQG